MPDTVEVTAASQATASVGSAGAAGTAGSEPAKGVSEMDFNTFMAPAMGIFANVAAHAAGRLRDQVDIINVGMGQGFAIDMRLITGAQAAGILGADNSSKALDWNNVQRSPNITSNPLTK